MSDNWYKDKDSSKYYKFDYNDGGDPIYLNFIPIVTFKKIYTIKFLISELDLDKE
jgi:hypothetical protein